MQSNKKGFEPHTSTTTCLVLVYAQRKAEGSLKDQNCNYKLRCQAKIYE